MITTFDIKGFKSVKDVHLDCKRINLFIGEPNTGKSNILEALATLSWCASSHRFLKEFVRFQLTQQLFYDGLTDEPIRIEYRGEPNGVLTVKFEKDSFLFSSNLQQSPQIASLNYDANQYTSMRLHGGEAFKFYRFKPLDKFDANDPGALIPPDGRNLFSVVYGSRTMREWLVELFRPYWLAVVMKPHEKNFEIQKEKDGVVTAYPYSMASDTLQRTLFYYAAINSNRNAVVVFAEPEAHAFPYYTKHLGECIALDENNNQYFIATHNPYLLSAIWEKANKGEAAVFATYYRNYETRVKPLTSEDMTWLFEADPFLGVSHLVEDAP